jgi:hypothetical protein
MKEMNVTEIVVKLPDELAAEAQQAGLLTPNAIEAILREAIRKQRVEHLFQTMEKLSGLTPPLTPAEIAMEIEQARQRRRVRNADRG